MAPTSLHRADLAYPQPAVEAETRRTDVGDVPAAQSNAERPSRATPASEICGAGIRGPFIYFKWGVCAGRHSGGLTVSGEMHGNGEEQVRRQALVEATPG